MRVKCAYALTPTCLQGFVKFGAEHTISVDNVGPIGCVRAGESKLDWAQIGMDSCRSANIILSADVCDRPARSNQSISRLILLARLAVSIVARSCALFVLFEGECALIKSSNVSVNHLSVCFNYCIRCDAARQRDGANALARTHTKSHKIGRYCAPFRP